MLCVNFNHFWAECLEWIVFLPLMVPIALELVSIISVCIESLGTNDGGDEMLWRIMWLVSCRFHYSNLVYLSQTIVIIGEVWVPLFVGSLNIHLFHGKNRVSWRCIEILLMKWWLFVKHHLLILIKLWHEI
jgi:hypothetical protein